MAQEKTLIVVGVDGSESSLDAARWAIRHAKSTNSKLLFAMAYEVSWWVNVNPVTTETDFGNLAHAAFDEALEKLELNDAGVEYQTQLIQMHPATALKRISEDADLLVVGGQGHGKLPGAHLGSVSGYCAHHAKCPVLIHRS
jgi:nucleotide-binding universal stress UspA family protein